MPAAVANPGTSSEAPSSQPSFMENLVSPDNESTIDGLFEGSTQDEGQQEYADSGSDQEQAAGTEQSTAQGPAEELIKLIADETGLDPSIPNQREAIERLAASAKFVDRLQGQAQAQDESGLTAFERSLMEPDEKGQTGAPAEQAAAAKPVQEQPVQQQGARQYGDIGDTWTKPEDSIVALTEAYQKGDPTAVHNIEMARFVRMFDGYGRRNIEALIQEKLKGLEGIEQFIPSLKQSHADQQYQNNWNAAFEGLAGEKGFEDIHDLGKVQDGQPIQLDGKSYPNTPLNQIVARNEWIRDIRVQHPDPNKAMQLTNAKQLRAVHEQYKRSQSTINPAQVKTLVNSAAKMGERQANDVTRQRLNAGTGSTKVGGGSQQPSFMESLTKSGGGELSVSDLLGRK